MRKYNGDGYRKIAILGSFGKHYDLICDVANLFTDNGFKVLVPRLLGIQENDSDFIILNGDLSDNPRELELYYLNKCLEADLVYVCDKDGYVGTTVAFELGVLSTYGQEIYFMERPSDQLFASMINIQETAICEPEVLLQYMSIHNQVWSSREWFDSSDRDETAPFSLAKKRGNTLITSINNK